MSIDADKFIDCLQYKIGKYSDKIADLYMSDNPGNKLIFMMAVQKALLEIKDIIEDIKE